MKRILITGANSYIGTSFVKWMSKCKEEYDVHEIDMKDGTWREKDFSGYDIIFHVAGIAHIKETKKNAHLYYKINRDLLYEVAKKAKASGVKQFIFLSSMSVYGMNTGVITRDTIPAPNSNYGKSKLQGEELISSLQDAAFNIVILRPPMVYGKGCKGNYNRLEKIALKSPIFPKIGNKRSMIHIDNLCEFLRLMIVNEEKGIFYPQNEEYSNTKELVRLISETNGKNIKLTKMFNVILKIMSKKIGIINKVFGNLVYDKSMSEYKDNYRVMDIKQSVIVTEMLPDVVNEEEVQKFEKYINDKKGFKFKNRGDKKCVKK